MYIFGRNNNHLIKNNHKTTFSLPQKIRLIQHQIIKCACGHDFVICLTNQLKPYCYFQSAVYNIDFKNQDKIVDIATQQNFLLFLTQKGELYGTEFMAEKLLNESIKPKIIKLNLGFLGLKQRKIKSIKIVNERIFLKLQSNLVIYLRRNDWMETKSFTDPEILQASKKSDIVDIVGNKKQLYFLTKDGDLLTSETTNLNRDSYIIEVKERLKKIVASQSQIFGISEEGWIVKVHVKNNKGKCEKVARMSFGFQDLVMGGQNFYAISQERQAWVWGKNAFGELGLSDYEPRKSPYPLVSLERFYIRHIFPGQNYVCCIVDESRVRESVRVSQRSLSVMSPIRQVKVLANANINFHTYRDSFNQTQQFLMPVRLASDQQSKVSNNANQNLTYQSANVIVNKRSSLSKDNCFSKHKNRQNQQNKRLNSSQNSISSKSKIQSKISNKKTPELSLHKLKSKQTENLSKLTPKSANRQKSVRKNQKQKISEYYVSTVSDVGKSNNKNYKKQAIVSYKTPTKPVEEIEKDLREKIFRQIALDFQVKLEEIQKQQDLKIRTLTSSHQVEKEKMEERILLLEVQLKNKSEQNKDLFDLISHKNLTIQDITAKIRLLEEAIQEHEKTLTARDNEAEEYFLRQKEYQLHIEKLQGQVEKMVQMLNYNQRNKEAELYKRQMQRLSSQIKERMQGEKQYYRERIKSVEMKFEEERNLYELQITRLRDELDSYHKKQSEMIARLKNQKPIQTDIQFPAKSLDYPSDCIESPTFHTLDIKQNIKKRNQQNQLNGNLLTLNDEVQQKQTLPLKELNRQDIYFSPLAKDTNHDIRTKKNSRVTHNVLQDENSMKHKSESQVKEIIQKIESNKNYISKSANKLFTLLQNDKPPQLT